MFVTTDELSLTIVTNGVYWYRARVDPKDPYTAGGSFYKMARSLLDDELEHPTITTVQALALMAKREAFRGKAVRGA